MARSRALSQQTKLVLAQLLDAPGGWSHGYDMARAAGMKSGTLYPLLIRLEAQGFVEAEWQQPVQGGRPPRHAYRLTISGVQLARQNPPNPATVVNYRVREFPV